MAISDRSVLCVYRYDPLDRLADCLAAGQGSARFFYQKNRLATQIQGQIQHSLLRTDEHLLAQRRTENNQSDCALLATDQQQSVIAAQGLAFAYTPYGHRQPSIGPMNLPGFTGQRVDPVTGHYLLGNGYRAFNPVLMRFNSPDSLSPFGEGGLNAYGYCAGDPVNGVDPSGHMPLFLKNTSSRGGSLGRTSLRRQINRANQANRASTSAPVNTSSGIPTQQSSITPMPVQGVAQPVGAPQPRQVSPPPYTPRDTTAPPPYTLGEIAAPLSSGPPPPYDPLLPGERVYLRPPRYTRDASPGSSMRSFDANGNYRRSAPASTPTNPALVRMNDAIQGLRRRGMLD
ncbi:RHS repeat-associated core domain-containing protein [Pseudomonas syringae]|uniref:RHS repeat-associated core domain-containing protein n=1 Tax=Pseudomonas syringae TaxID=317 RepID=UPI001F2895E8|nr:RHS repeat-associated core domain-containing protein [Pseudomonas syringae]MBL3831874.1 RHS repeat-associated core domain-containing protein [Pseudomonas syringae pv. theae]MBL3833729.1 RHS repeat-associated core domain-containing protein [Pseudomonas syringae pv. theae]MBL3866888.1 RHS repeat-associated core domain-containing protein [Pseudomonas syringae pv. theae]